MIYLDHHATTPVAPAARRAMAAWLAREHHANPSSVHAAGRAARLELERAREALARAAGASPRELVFTSGGTEAVHLAVRGVGEGMGARSVLLDPGAHPALRAACEALAGATGASLEALPSLVGGAPDLPALASRLAELAPPALLAVSWVQHETGAIAPVRALAELAHARDARLVLDAAQALGKVPVDLGATGASAAALSAHKIGGPAGIGAAWLAAGAPVTSQVRGGAQERGVRAGTENVLGAVGFGAAAGALAERLAAMPEVARRRDQLARAFEPIDGVVLSCADRPRVATACHVAVRGVAGEELVAALDLAGVCVSSGPACSSGRPGPSASMLAMYPAEPWRASSALRITLGPETTDAEVAAVCALLPEVIARVRAG